MGIATLILIAVLGKYRRKFQHFWNKYQAKIIENSMLMAYSFNVSLPDGTLNRIKEYPMKYLVNLPTAD